LKTLSEGLLGSDVRPTVIKDCARLIDTEVANKRGISGVAIKGGYMVFKKVKPTAVEDAMDSLLDEFVAKLQPIHRDFQENHSTQPLAGYLSQRGDMIANTLLENTDVRAEHSPNKVVRGAYFKLRPTAERQLKEALPAVAGLVDKYTR